MIMPPTIIDAPEVLSPGAFAKSLPAHLLASGLNINSLRTNTLLRKDEWELLDARVVEIAANTLRGIADLRAAGLTVPLGGLGVLVSQYETVSDMTDASVNMAAEVDDEEDRINYTLVGVPVPIISKSFRIDIRSLSASRMHGGLLDTTHVDTATRKVAEMLEYILFNGSTIVQRGQVVYGYTNHASRNTVSGGADWGTATNIIPNFNAMLGALIVDNMYGPYKLYLHPDQYVQTFALNASTSVPIIRTMESMPGMGPGSIQPTNYITAGQGVLVAMNRDVVDLAIGQDILPVEWDTKGGLTTRWKVLAAMIPRVKADAGGRSGIAHISGI
jgi:uncharacterized linocin/CFP29 family protein